MDTSDDTDTPMDTTAHKSHRAPKEVANRHLLLLCLEQAKDLLGSFPFTKFEAAVSPLVVDTFVFFKTVLGKQELTHKDLVTLLRDIQSARKQLDLLERVVKEKVQF